MMPCGSKWKGVLKKNEVGSLLCIPNSSISVPVSKDGQEPPIRSSYDEADILRCRKPSGSPREKCARSSAKREVYLLDVGLTKDSLMRTVVGISIKRKIFAVQMS